MQLYMVIRAWLKQPSHFAVYQYFRKDRATAQFVLVTRQLTCPLSIMLGFFSDAALN